MAFWLDCEDGSIEIDPTLIPHSLFVHHLTCNTGADRIAIPFTLAVIDTLMPHWTFHDTLSQPCSDPPLSRIPTALLPEALRAAAYLQLDAFNLVAYQLAFELNEARQQRTRYYLPLTVEEYSVLPPTLFKQTATPPTLWASFFQVCGSSSAQLHEVLSYLIPSSEQVLQYVQDGLDIAACIHNIHQWWILLGPLLSARYVLNATRPRTATLLWDMARWCTPWMARGAELLAGHEQSVLSGTLLRFYTSLMGPLGPSMYWTQGVTLGGIEVSFQDPVAALVYRVVNAGLPSGLPTPEHVRIHAAVVATHLANTPLAALPVPTHHVELRLQDPRTLLEVPLTTLVEESVLTGLALQARQEQLYCDSFGGVVQALKSIMKKPVVPHQVATMLRDDPALVKALQSVKFHTTVQFRTLLSTLPQQDPPSIQPW